MTDTAFQAEFVGIKHVKGRGAMQIILEVPAETGNSVLTKLGGLPVNGESRWVGVARINGEQNGNS